jgi:hypothetical protein
MENYYIKLHAVGRKKTSGYTGPDEVCAHFSTPAKVGTITFEEAKMDAVDHYWDQNKRYWHGYRIGKLMVQTGSEPVSIMSPAYDYHKGRSFPVYKEVK